MTGMNEKVRVAVIEALEQRGMSKRRLAEHLEMQPSNLARLLNGRSGSVPTGWQEILDALDLELIAIPKKPD